MTTAVDSSVLYDIVLPDPQHGERSREALREAVASGRVIACPVVWAEMRGAFASRGALESAMREAEVEFDPFDRYDAERAGAMWKAYRNAGGTRTRLLGDFFVAAHALGRDGRLLSRDRGFYRRYFSGLELLG